MYPTIYQIRKLLTQIRDIERICRQIVMRKIYPSSIYYLYNSIDQVIFIYNKLINNEVMKNYLKKNNILDICINIKKFLEHHLFLDKCKTTSSMNNFDDCIIQPGVNSDLDNLNHSINENNRLFKYIYELFNNVMKENEGKDIEYVKIHLTEKSGTSLLITKKRAISLKEYIGKKKDEEIPQLNGTKWSDIKFTKSSNTCDEINFTFL